MEMAELSGLTVPLISASIAMVRDMARVSSHLQTVTSMMESMWMGRRRVKVFKPLPMEIDTRDPGYKVNHMGSRCGLSPAESPVSKSGSRDSQVDG